MKIERKYLKQHKEGAKRLDTLQKAIRACKIVVDEKGKLKLK